MHLTRLALTDFRSYPAVDVRLEPGVSTFTGANGEGKTNLVEAAYYLATFGSHRVSADAPMVRSGASRAILRAAVTTAGHDSLVEIELNPGRANRVRLNRMPLRRPREALGTLRCVLFAPEDLAVVKGDPDQRRRYLDDLLTATRPRYAAIRSDYERVVRQRTALLKSARARGISSPGGLEAWDEQLVTSGAELTAGRLALMSALRPLAAAAYAAVSADDRAAGMSYRQPSAGGTEPDADAAKLAEVMRQALDGVRRAELDRAVCLVGPHRDELELRIGELPARGYASHGESWSMALALRLAAYDLLRSAGDDPVLMLDDVFAELDAGRRDRLAALVAGAEQVVVTAAVPQDVPQRLAGARFTVSAGTVSRAA
ncbi:MAG TPA: DNA replication/repair protein RecF [Streptosporangiaceae bacterium]